MYSFVLNILLRVCFGGTVFGRANNPINEGLLLKWIRELNIARLSMPDSEIVPIRFACFIPTIELIRFAR